MYITTPPKKGRGAHRLPDFCELSLSNCDTIKSRWNSIKAGCIYDTERTI